MVIPSALGDLKNCVSKVSTDYVFFKRIFNIFKTSANNILHSLLYSFFYSYVGLSDNGSTGFKVVTEINWQVQNTVHRSQVQVTALLTNN